MPIIRKIIDRLNTYEYDNIVDYYIDSDDKIVLNIKNDFDKKIVEFYNFLVECDNIKKNKLAIVTKIENLFCYNNKKINNDTELINTWNDDKKQLHILVKATYWYEISIEFIYNEKNYTYSIINALISSQTGRGVLTNTIIFILMDLRKWTF